MIRGVIVFGTGVYTGVYLAQNYEIPKVDDAKELQKAGEELIAQIKKVEDPASLVNKFISYVEEKSKEGGKK